MTLAHIPRRLSWRGARHFDKRTWFLCQGHGRYVKEMIEELTFS